MIARVMITDPASRGNIGSQTQAMFEPLSTKTSFP